MKTSPLRASAILFCIGLFASASHAQVITSNEIERGLRFRHTLPYDGEPFTQRYSYSLGDPSLFFNVNSRYLHYLHYLDRAERAEKFGYRIPADPYFGGPTHPPEPGEVVEAPPRPVRAGFGLGIFRRR